MNNIFKTFSIFTLGVTLSIASTLEYPSFYKDARIMGMGGANIALGGEAASLFYNPAGLSGMHPDEGVELEMFNLNAIASQNIYALYTDIMANSDDMGALMTSFESYYGENNHLTVNDYTSVSYRGDSYAFSFGVLASTQMNLQTHALGVDSGILEINGLVAAGLITGFSYDINSDIHVGLGVKYFAGYSLASDLTYGEITSLLDAPDMVQYVVDNYATQFSAVSYDLGLIYDFDKIIPLGETLQPSIGISLLNIGGTDLGLYGAIPMTVNIGIALHPEIPFLDEWAFTVDYVDVLNAYNADFNGDGILEYDTSWTKRLRMGAKATLFHNAYVQVDGSTGLYNLAFTAGLEVRLTVLTFAFSTFAEEIGAYAGQNLDRRYQFAMNLGF